MRKFKICLIIGLLMAVGAVGQETYKEEKVITIDTLFSGGEKHPIVQVRDITTGIKPKNIILLIGDGMGVAHVSAGLAANNGVLNMQSMKYAGLVKTSSADKYITDSAAAGTALAAGVKTYNGAIGVDENKKPVTNIREELEKKGLATGVVSTSAITHATPASFVAHQPKRSMYEEIAADFLKTDINLFIGGGMSFFNEREDKRDLIDELAKKNYAVYNKIDAIDTKQDKVACLTAAKHNPSVGNKRGEMLIEATQAALEVLDNDPDGFFVMIEGSQIDWGGHKKNATYVIEELLDFDKAIGVALDYASNDGETLVIVTSDHETGGMAVEDADVEIGKVKTDFTSFHHTGEMVPIFSYGPGAEYFTGIMDNTDIPKIIRELVKD